MHLISVAFEGFIENDCCRYWNLMMNNIIYWIFTSYTDHTADLYSILKKRTSCFKVKEWTQTCQKCLKALFWSLAFTLPCICILLQKKNWIGLNIFVDFSESIINKRVHITNRNIQTSSFNIMLLAFNRFLIKLSSCLWIKLLFICQNPCIIRVPASFILFNCEVISHSIRLNESFTEDWHCLLACSLIPSTPVDQRLIFLCTTGIHTPW